MILISNKPFDISEIINNYPQNSIERQLLDTMTNSSEKYRYDSLKQLLFELRLRKETVNSARDLYKSGLSFADFNRSRSNSDYWDQTDNGGFKLKPGVSPSDAIHDIFINGHKYATECATAMLIVFYKALLNIFSEELFNKQFSDIYLMNWQITEPLLKEVGIPKKVSDVLLGDRGYFKNPDVNPQTPEWQGENVIVLPDGLYYGHGIGIKTAENMIHALNNNRKKNATQSAYFIDSVSRPNYKKLSDIYYRSIPQSVASYRQLLMQKRAAPACNPE